MNLRKATHRASKKIKMPKICALGLHDWPKWGPIKKRKDHAGSILEAVLRYQQRQCRKCKAVDERTV